MQLDGVGYERSKAVEDKFPGNGVVSGMEQMMAASEKDWMSIDGIGKLSAQRIFRQLHGRNEIIEKRRKGKKGDSQRDLQST